MLTHLSSMPSRAAHRFCSWMSEGAPVGMAPGSFTLSDVELRCSVGRAGIGFAACTL